MVRKISANYIFPVISEPIKNGVIVINDKNIITEIIDSKGKLTEQANLEFYNGILVPGFAEHNDLTKDKQSKTHDCFSIKNKQAVIDNMVADLEKNTNLTFKDLLFEHTLKKALSLGCEAKFGSFEIGKSPRINLISPFDFQKLTLKKESKIKSLV